MKNIPAADMTATWTVVQEQAGVPSLLGTVVRIEVQQVNPFIRRAVITPTTGSASNSQHSGIFGRIKPSVALIEGDTIMCSLGIIAKRNP